MSNAPTQGPTAGAHPPRSITPGPTRGDTAPPTRWKKLLRQLGMPDPSYANARDDRGDPLPPSSIDVATLRTIKPSEFKWNPKVDPRTVVPIIVGIGAYTVVGHILTPYTGRFAGHAISCATMVLILRAFIWLYSRDGIAHRFFAGNMLRAARCPCCGYELHDLAPADDGRVPCPECGAAWHVDRWKGSLPDAKRLLTRALDAGMSKAVLRVHMDDRGVHLPDGTRWKCPWHADFLRSQRTGVHLDPRMESFSRATWKARERVIRRKFRDLSICFLTIALAVFIAGEDGDGRGLAIVIVLLGVPGSFLFAATNSDHRVPLRATALQHSLCPACGELLDLNQPRQFDGCIQCAKCAAAWKVDADASPRTPASSHYSGALDVPNEGPTSV